jgi:hypothetical protein
MPSPPPPAPPSPDVGSTDRRFDPIERPMREADARRALLLQAFESPPVGPWTPQDTAEISDEARRVVGERGSDAELMAVRARQGLARLSSRDAHLADVLDRAQAAARWPRWALGVAVAVAATAGVAIDAVGAEGRIHLLAPPLLGLLAWNIVAYMLLATGALRRPTRRPGPGHATAATPAARGALASAWAGVVERLGVRALVRRAASGLPGEASNPVREALARFALSWARASRPLALAHATTSLHAAAAALAAGALASLYLRGLAFEYRAGWDSTFLDATAARALLGVVLGPASTVTGIALPDATTFGTLRFGAGNGENAAHWIHLWGMTLAGAIVIPRLLLALGSAWRARRLADALPVPLIASLALGRSGSAAAPSTAWLLPFGAARSAPETARAARALSEAFGQRITGTPGPAITEGAEDAVASMATPPQRPELVVAWLSLGATPERETHGRFLDGLAARAARERWRLVVLVDESGFAERLPPAQAEARRRERREAWRRLARAVGAEPVFADVSATGLADR